MNEWLAQLDINSAVTGMLAGLLLAGLAAWVAWRRGEKSGAAPLRDELAEAQELLAEARAQAESNARELAVSETRREEQQQHFERERSDLQKAEKRLTESFENLAAKIFDQRSKNFTELSEKQLEGLLKPLTRDLKDFKQAVEVTNKESIARHGEMSQKLKQLESLNQTLHQEAQNLTRALTHDVKAQGNWGEQQLERLMEIAGLEKSKHYFTQLSVKGKDGSRLQPDFVLQLPENTAIVLDSKVSLKSWTLYQSAVDEAEREAHLARHLQSLRAHIRGLAEKNYPEAEELNALDFVLMFVPIESALIAALQADPVLPEFALQNKVALLSPSNFLATARTVASVWQVHQQNTNAQEIARRGGLLYDKFKGFVDNMQSVGQRIDQANQSYQSAWRQLTAGPGNLVSQADQLRGLGARLTKQLEQKVVDEARESDPDASHLRLIEAEADAEAVDNDESEGRPEQTGSGSGD